MDVDCGDGVRHVRADDRCRRVDDDRGLEDARHLALLGVMWASFSLAATALQRFMATLLFVSPMMEVTSPVAVAALLLIAGTY